MTRVKNLFLAMISQFGNTSRFTPSLKTRVGKYRNYDEVCIDGQIYWLPTSKRQQVRDIGVTEVIRRATGTTYSDHSLMYACEPMGRTRVGTFNACLTNLALRGLQGVCNSSGEYKGKITGQRFCMDEERRRHVTDYIIATLQDCEILLLQEIDLDACERLRTCGVNVMYTEEYHNSVRGGNAICSRHPRVVLHDPEPIWDRWGDGEHQKKHVGTYCVATIGSRSISVASYHFDEDTQIDIVLPFMRNRLCIFGGDFNKDVTKFASNLSITNRFVERMTANDPTRSRTIDAIFFCEVGPNIQKIRK